MAAAESVSPVTLKLKLTAQLAANWPHLPAGLLAALILAWRLAQVRELALPAWVDSVHHALLVRLLLEQGGLAATWAPYLPDVPFYYHFGFHLTATTLAAGLGLNVGQAVLLAGQLWQAVMALGVYSLGLAVWQRRSTALAAMLLVGFVSQMPAYYTTWGRYPLLAGLALLSLALAAAIARRPVTLALLTAAVAITHTYAFLLLLLFGAILLALPGEGRKPRFAGLAGGVLLASPWLAWLLAQSVERQLLYVETGAQEAGYSLAYIGYLLGPARNVTLLALAGLGLLLSLRLIWREWGAAHRAGLTALTAWTLLLLGLLGPWRLGPLRPDLHAALVVFLPAVVLAAGALSRLHRPKLAALLLGGLLLWGIAQTRNIINPVTVLATPADVSALAWLEAHTPPTATFLIDVAPWEAQWRGVDGGWWIMPLTGRQTVLPPLVYGWGSPARLQHIRSSAVQIYALRQVSDAAYCQRLTQLSRANGAAYYYTRSTRPDLCAAWQRLYRRPHGPAIYFMGGSDQL